MQEITQAIKVVDQTGKLTSIKIDNSTIFKDCDIVQSRDEETKQINIQLDVENKILTFDLIKLEGLAFDVFMNFINQK